MIIREIKKQDSSVISEIHSSVISEKIKCNLGIFEAVFIPGLKNFLFGPGIKMKQP